VTREDLEKDRLPLFRNPGIPPLVDAIEQTLTTGWGMLDIVQYHNQKVPVERGYNVAPHSDPGLFSIHTKSNNPGKYSFLALPPSLIFSPPPLPCSTLPHGRIVGLEMLDPPTNEWIPIPVGASVIFCGAKAHWLTKKRIKMAMHRVEAVALLLIHMLYPCLPQYILQAYEPRTTMWYEVCTYEQVSDTVANKGIAAAVPLCIFLSTPPPSPSEESSNSNESRVDLPEDRIISVRIKNLTGKVDVVKVPANATIDKLKNALQDVSGTYPLLWVS